MSLDPGTGEAAVAADADLLSSPAPAPTVDTPRGERAAPARRATWPRVALELGHDLAVAALVCTFLIVFVAQAFRVQGTSMQPLLEDGERIIVNKIVYRFEPIERGDVVVFHFPRDPKVSFIKRVVGLPGDVVELRRGVVVVNGRPLAEPYMAPAQLGDESREAREVEQGYYYVLGDHRGSSNDSRTWGLVPERYIYGKAWFRFWPFSRSGVIR